MCDSQDDTAWLLGWHESRAHWGQLLQVRPVNAAASSQPDDRGSQSGFVPLLNLQRPINWADDIVDADDSRFVPQVWPWLPDACKGSRLWEGGDLGCPSQRPCTAWPLFDSVVLQQGFLFLHYSHQDQLSKLHNRNWQQDNLSTAC